ncbi:hypothetical protein CPAV1605_678 [seawater metagenome]|uniref:Uncharacterized protein n=1 Tax=seawater metagenome TaxID=1561972 RepID=A0A5E8CHV8_9ZZZZ
MSNLLNELNKYIIKKNYYKLKLQANTEIKVIKDPNIYYYIIVADTSEKQDIFCDYLAKYNLLSKTNNLFLPIDFEFNSKVIALMQMNFETEYNDRMIFIIYPPVLTKRCRSRLIKKILGNKNILKILHGSDSLDMPYLLTELIQNRKYQKKFIYSFTDTRYYCEFFNYQKNLIDRKCKIYSVLLDKGIITQKKLDQLYKNEEAMGPIYNIIINIYHMSQPLILYTMYDVLYLKYLYQSYPLKDHEYGKLIPELIRLVFLERKNIRDQYQYINQIVDKINNYFIYQKENKVKLIQVFNHILPKLINKNYTLETLLKVNYFKRWLHLIIKYIVYSIINTKYTIFEKKGKKFKEPIPLKLILLKKSRFKILNDLIKKIIEKINKEIIYIYNNEKSSMEYLWK